MITPATFDRDALAAMVEQAALEFDVAELSATITEEQYRAAEASLDNAIAIAASAILVQQLEARR